MNFKYIVERGTKQRIVEHFLFWIAVICHLMLYFWHPNPFLVKFKYLVINLPGEIFFIYFTLYFLLPRYLLRKKYLSFLVSFLLLGYFNEVVRTAVLRMVFHPDLEYPVKSYFIHNGLFNIFYTYFYATVAIALHLTRKWYLENQLAKKVLEDKFRAELKLKDLELNLLKAQLHPHFLFNTLNNLYGLTLEKSDKASEIVLRMSKLLSYMLYECNVESVLLKKEIDHVLNYISIEALRYDDDLKLDIINNCKTSGKHIAPLVILPFIENCFKHGVTNTVGKSWMKVHFDSTENFDFVMNVENSISESGGTPKNGIGLRNVRQRLNSIYPNGHRLSIKELDGKFSVSLKLKL